MYKSGERRRLHVVQTLSVMDSFSFQLLLIGMEFSQRVKREYLILHIHSHAFDMSQLRPRLNAEPCLGFEAILQGWRRYAVCCSRKWWSAKDFCSCVLDGSRAVVVTALFHISQLHEIRGKRITG